MITWKYVKRLDNTELIDSFLEKHHVQLPDVLTSLIKENNGGRPSDKTIITDSNREHVFKSLLSYNEHDLETVYSVYPDLFIDTQLFPVGSDAAGNFICYNRENGKICLYNHETDTVEDIIKIPCLLLKEYNNQG